VTWTCTRLDDEPGSSRPGHRAKNNCNFLIHLENLPLAPPDEVPDPRLDDFRSAVVAGFDLTLDVPDGARGPRPRRPSPPGVWSGRAG
jgi:hypothetical protein